MDSAPVHKGRLVDDYTNCWWHIVEDHIWWSEVKWQVPTEYLEAGDNELPYEEAISAAGGDAYKSYIKERDDLPEGVAILSDPETFTGSFWGLFDPKKELRRGNESNFPCDLDWLYALDARSHAEALGYLFSAMNDALRAGHEAQSWPDIEALLRAFDHEHCSSYLHVGMLGITLPIRGKTNGARSAFLEKAERRMVREIGVDRTCNNLRGLR